VAALEARLLVQDNTAQKAVGSARHETRLGARFARPERSDAVFTEEDVEVVTTRARAWSAALRDLSEPAACRELLGALDEGDGEALHKLVDEWRLPGPVRCIEIIDTITRFVHTGDYEPTESCSFVNTLRPLAPSTTSGRGYRLADGSFLWLTEAEWWQMFDRAAHDESWRKENHNLLVAIGILICTFEMIPTVTRFDIDKRYTICTRDWGPES
jgi:hypothetical protein